MMSTVLYLLKVAGNTLLVCLTIILCYYAVLTLVGRMPVEPEPVCMSCRIGHASTH